MLVVDWLQDEDWWIGEVIEDWRIGEVIEELRIGEVIEELRIGEVIEDPPEWRYGKVFIQISKFFRS